MRHAPAIQRYSYEHQRKTHDEGDTRAIVLLDRLCDTLPMRSLEHDIVVCALLYLENDRPCDREPGHSVERWMNAQLKGAA